MSVPTIQLNDGTSIPQLGFGVFQVPPADTEQAVSVALEVGYRHIDTAEMYGNEQGVGDAVRASGLDRGDVYITSKLNNGFHRPEDARRAFGETLEALGSDYVDLFLIHWPLPTLYDGDFVSTWQTMEEFKAAGGAKSIGVSNFQVAHLERLANETDTVPAVNQIELHPYFHNSDVADYCAAHGIAIEAWAPLAEGRGHRRPGADRDRRASREDVGSGRAPLAHPARAHRLPEVGHPGTRQGELRAVRLRALVRRRSAHRCARPRRGRTERPEPGHVRLHPELSEEVVSEGAGGIESLT